MPNQDNKLHFSKWGFCREELSIEGLGPELNPQTSEDLV